MFFRAKLKESATPICKILTYPEYHDGRPAETYLPPDYGIPQFNRKQAAIELQEALDHFPYERRLAILHAAGEYDASSDDDGLESAEKRSHFAQAVQWHLVAIGCTTCASKIIAAAGPHFAVEAACWAWESWKNFSGSKLMLELILIGLTHANLGKDRTNEVLKEIGLRPMTELHRFKHLRAFLNGARIALRDVERIHA
ncbi:hypothetical protein MYX07_01660 [Patescibacteria group bacterium AH-259-L07]|nr:hypothetical protein [Patescibacteria group bacterium AH-259-L07]